MAEAAIGGMSALGPLKSPQVLNAVTSSPGAFAQIYHQLQQTSRGEKTPGALLLDSVFSPGMESARLALGLDSSRLDSARLFQKLQEHLGGDVVDDSQADAILGGLMLPSARGGRPGSRSEGLGNGGGGGGAAGSGGAQQLSIEQLEEMGLQSPSAMGVAHGGSVLYKGVMYDKERDVWQVVVFDGTNYQVCLGVHVSVKVYVDE
jgi:hypothetical protein